MRPLLHVKSIRRRKAKRLIAQMSQLRLPLQRPLAGTDSTGDVAWGGFLNRNAVSSFSLVPPTSVLTHTSHSESAATRSVQPSPFPVEETEARRGQVRTSDLPEVRQPEVWGF